MCRLFPANKGGGDKNGNVLPGKGPGCLHDPCCQPLVTPVLETEGCAPWMLRRAQQLHMACHCACAATSEALPEPKSENPKMCGCPCAGTVIDTGITHPTDYEFLLNSHASIQGTSRPALYTVLLDQNRFSADELQAFSYKCGTCAPHTAPEG